MMEDLLGRSLEAGKASMKETADQQLESIKRELHKELGPKPEFFQSARENLTQKRDELVKYIDPDQSENTEKDEKGNYKSEKYRYYIDPINKFYLSLIEKINQMENAYALILKAAEKQKEIIHRLDILKKVDMVKAKELIYQIISVDLETDRANLKRLGSISPVFVSLDSIYSALTDINTYANNALSDFNSPEAQNFIYNEIRKPLADQLNSFKAESSAINNAWAYKANLYQTLNERLDNQVVLQRKSTSEQGRITAVDEISRLEAKYTKELAPQKLGIIEDLEKSSNGVEKTDSGYVASL